MQVRIRAPIPIFKCMHNRCANQAKKSSWYLTHVQENSSILLNMTCCILIPMTPSIEIWSYADLIPRRQTHAERVSLFPPKSCLRHLENSRLWNPIPSYVIISRSTAAQNCPPRSWHENIFFLVFCLFFLSCLLVSLGETSSQTLCQRREGYIFGEKKIFFSQFRNHPMHKKGTRTA